MQKNKSNLVIYSDGELELKISVTDETIWLTQAQLSDIFEKDQSVISRHINNIFKDNEVDENANWNPNIILFNSSSGFCVG